MGSEYIFAETVIDHCEWQMTSEGLQSVSDILIIKVEDLLQFTREDCWTVILTITLFEAVCFLKIVTLTASQFKSGHHACNSADLFEQQRFNNLHHLQDWQSNVITSSRLYSGFVGNSSTTVIMPNCLGNKSRSLHFDLITKWLQT